MRKGIKEYIQMKLPLVLGVDGLVELLEFVVVIDQYLEDTVDKAFDILDLIHLVSFYLFFLVVEISFVKYLSLAVRLLLVCGIMLLVLQPDYNIHPTLLLLRKYSPFQSIRREVNLKKRREESENN